MLQLKQLKPVKKKEILCSKSQGKYPRYLEVVNIINNTKTIKQNENATHASTPVIQTPLAQAPNN